MTTPRTTTTAARTTTTTPAAMAADELAPPASWALGIYASSVDDRVRAAAIEATNLARFREVATATGASQALQRKALDEYATATGLPMGPAAAASTAAANGKRPVGRPRIRPSRAKVGAAR